MSEDLDFPKFTYGDEQPPTRFQDLASEVLQESEKHSRGVTAVTIDPILIIGIAQLLFSIFKYCKPEKIQNSLNRIRRHPNGLYAQRIAARLYRSMPDGGYDRWAASYKTLQVCANKSSDVSFLQSMPEAE